MLVIKTLEDIKKFPYPVVVMGNFDGVHKGHKKMIQETISRAKEHNGTSVVITYNPNTKVFFGLINKNQLLQTQAEKLKDIAILGVDVVVIIPFTTELSQMTAEDFTKEVLVDTLGVKEVIVGYDTVFGKDKKGNKDFLVEYGKKHGFSVFAVSVLLENNEIISSTKLRKNI